MSRCSACRQEVEYECLSGPNDPEGYEAYCAECAPDLHKQLDDYLAEIQNRTYSRP